MEKHEASSSLDLCDRTGRRLLITEALAHIDLETRESVECRGASIHQSSPLFRVCRKPFQYGASGGSSLISRPVHTGSRRKPSLDAEALCQLPLQARCESLG